VAELNATLRDLKSQRLKGCGLKLRFKSCGLKAAALK
jgi:hypothetical protein